MNLLRTYHYNDVIMGAIVSQITSLTIVYSTNYSNADKKNPSKLRVTGICVWGIHLGPVNSPHKWPVMRKMLHLMTSSCDVTPTQQRTKRSCTCLWNLLHTISRSRVECSVLCPTHPGCRGVIFNITKGLSNCLLLGETNCGLMVYSQK